MAVELPCWINDLRSREVIDRVARDPRSGGNTLLGVDAQEAFDDVLEGGQADFDTAHGNLTPEDRVLLYAYLLQKGHLEELTTAFRMCFSDNAPDQPVVVDLGCGPFTGGLALAATLGADAQFDYIGMDRSLTMQEFGERLASAASLDGIRRRWCQNLPSAPWSLAPGWRPVVVIASYLLKSPTLNAVDLVADLRGLLDRIGFGPVTALYTNAIDAHANRGFPSFRDALNEAGFQLHANDVGEIRIARGTDTKERRLRYALFHRPKQRRVRLGGRS